MRRRHELIVAAALAILFAGWVTARAAEPPTIPVGLDAYRQWARWPYQRIGMRTYMRSTYDRTGGNEGADASHFLFQLADDNNVTLDLEGPGILTFERFNHWHGSPWHFVVDGTDHIIRESSTADPAHPIANSTFLPASAFPAPLALTWSATRGADLNWVPIPFTQSFRLAYSRTHYGTGYYIYQQFVPGTPLSHPITAWKEQPPPEDVLALIRRAGTDIAPAPGAPGVKVEAASRRFLLARSGGDAASTHTASQFLQTLAVKDPAMLRALEFSVPRTEAIAFGRARLRVTWDDQPYPSIDAPVALFFGTGTLYNRDNREYLVKAFPMSVRFDAARVHLACYFPMPFFHSVRIEVLNNGDTAISGLEWSARYVPFNDPPATVGYFHATYRDHPIPILGHDLVLLDTRTTEGGGDWSGQLVGTSFIFSHRANLETLEGDPRFFFDDSQTPQVQGTGTEEWGGGGDYWGGQNMTMPFVGHPVGASSPKAARNDEDKIESAYRFLLGDMMPFGKNALIGLEHGGTDESTEHYETVAYWYGRHEASLVKTDVLQIGDPASESAHSYLSPQASAPYEVTSRYEWGVDTIAGHEIFPATTDRGRKTTGTSEFTLTIDPRNIGVMLRRKLDYAYPNQRAEVSIADATGAWQPAGIWYLAGSNTCIYSNPKGELGTTQHIVQTSNRRFRDDEFLLPRTLTAGRSTIRMRIKLSPANVPLFPGHPQSSQAWTELRYNAYCWLYP